MQNVPLCIGIDEAGRGPIAGPVSVAAFLFKPKLIEEIELFHLPLKDSKKLSQQKRELWYAQIKKWQRKGLCHFAVTMAGSKEIDQKGISLSIKKCLTKSLYKIEKKMCEKYGICETEYMVLLDGGLKAPEEYKHQETIIKGDEKIKCIALASIVAKVERDRYMERKDKYYPEYAFIDHKGYGTKDHYKMIKKYGLSPLHRKSFLTKVKY